jgi:hypothetical protein
VRNEEKGKPWKALGADIASADFDDAVSLTRAFANLGERPLLIPPNNQTTIMGIKQAACNLYMHQEM